MEVSYDSYSQHSTGEACSVTSTKAVRVVFVRLEDVDVGTDIDADAGVDTDTSPMEDTSPKPQGSLHLPRSQGPREAWLQGGWAPEVPTIAWQTHKPRGLQEMTLSPVPSCPAEAPDVLT